MGIVTESKDLLTNMFTSQKLAVLSTQYNGQPYSNLVAFVHTDDLKYIIFVTNRNTRKYGNVVADKRISILVDSRAHKKSGFGTAVAITALGTAEEAIGRERQQLAKLYLAKHTNLKEFVNKRTSAVIKITVHDYIIANFDKVRSFRLPD